MATHALVLAGGAGSRLWPISRKNRPKPVQEFLAGQSMLATTLERLKTFVPDVHIVVATGSEQEPHVRTAIEQWPNVDLLVEPFVRSTAPIIAFATAWLQHTASVGQLVVFPSDHYFGKPDNFFQAFDVAQDLASRTDSLVLFGAQPSYPASKYGYVKTGNRVAKESGAQAFEVETFVEKPTVEKAAKMLADGSYLWNMGIFLGSLSSFEHAYKVHAPALWEKVESIKSALGTDREKEILDNEYMSMETTSIDYAVVERCQNLMVIPCDAGWVDLGDWAAIHNALRRDRAGNTLLGNAHAIDSVDSYLHGRDKPIIGVGLSGVIAIDSGDAILLVSRDKAQNVSKVQDYLHENGMDHLL